MDVLRKQLVGQIPRSERPSTMLYTTLWASSSTTKVDFALADPE